MRSRSVTAHLLAEFVESGLLVAVEAVDPEVTDLVEERIEFGFLGSGGGGGCPWADHDLGSRRLARRLLAASWARWTPTELRDLFAYLQSKKEDQP